MARALSQDLRDRVVGAIEGGLSCRAAAARFGVGAATAIRWRQLVLQHGRAVARKQGGDKRSGRIEAHADFLLALVEGEGDPTLAEMQVRLAERGTPVASARCTASSPVTGSRGKKDGPRQRAGPPGRPEAARGLV